LPTLQLAIAPIARDALGSPSGDFFLPGLAAVESTPARSARKEASLDVEDLYRRYGPMVLRRCRWMLHDDAWAKDALQDVFVQLLRRESLVVEHPSSLLHRIATNVCLNLLRSRKRHPEDSEDDLLLRIASSEDHGGQIEARSVLDRLFGREKESTRTIAVMHLLDGYTLEEVARETGLSVSGVRKRLRALRGRVRELEALG
jgi:RNA polymerase sigma-70 factor (ECF subfamily)